jgi:hypothetical protein
MHSAFFSPPVGRAPRPGPRNNNGEMKMSTSRTFSLITVFLAAALLLLAPFARAEMVQADETLPQSQVETDREKVRSFLDRAAVTERLKALGVEDGLLKPRVDALTNEEVRILAQKIDALPAGGALSDFQVIMIVLLVAILIAIIA